LVGKTDSFIKNSKDFVEKSKTIVLTETDRLVSFDVESLFTNVPVPETLKIIEDRLSKDETLGDRTNLPVNVIMELLELCTKCNFFELEGKIYRQDEGMAMGSPLSPIFAIVYFITRVESGVLHVRDHVFEVRDLSSTLNGREHAKHFHSSFERYFSLHYHVKLF
jgi:hypothetical protein